MRGRRRKEKMYDTGPEICLFFPNVATTRNWEFPANSNAALENAARFVTRDSLPTLANQFA